MKGKNDWKRYISNEILPPLAKGKYTSRIENL
jgi:hypothetical protein